MSFLRITLASVFLLTFAIALLAQGGIVPGRSGFTDQVGACRDIGVAVRDPMGMAVIGATVVTEDSVMKFMTNAQGFVTLPCINSMSMMKTMDIRAPGYEAERVTIMPNTQSRYDVTLRPLDPMPTGSRLTVNMQELQKPVQQESHHLQSQAENAIHHNDYGDAEKLYLQALKLTPSDASIPNNLGVIALRRSDLNAASTWLEMATQIDPYNTDFEVNLGIVRWMQNRREESYKCLMNAVARGYESSLGNYIIGAVSLEKGLSEEAADYLKKVSRERYPYRDLFLSIALRDLGKAREADELYRGFLKRNPFPFAFMPWQTGKPIVETPLLLAVK